MIAAFLTLVLVLAPYQAATHPISDSQKNEFIELLKTLPRKGEFFTDDGVKTAKPYMPVLFALDEKDLEKYDIYPFGAISRGLCDEKENREYAIKHFGEIRHPTLKLLWGAMLFDSGTTSSEVVQFLRSAVESKAQSVILSEMLGPNYQDFVKRLTAESAAQPCVSTRQPA